MAFYVSCYPGKLFILQQVIRLTLWDIQTEVKQIHHGVILIWVPTMVQQVKRNVRGVILI